MDALTQSKLREIVRYHPESGVFEWVSPARSRKAIGCVSHGYLKISVRGHGGIYAHRLAWLYMTGEMPLKSIDHADRNRLNNAWSNLRLASPQQQAANSLRTARNIAGAKGVVAHRDYYRARICVDGNMIYLGDYNSVPEAAAAYAGAAKIAFGEFARTA